MNAAIRYLTFQLVACMLMSTQTSPLTGCSSPEVLDSNVKVLVDQNWNNLDEQTVRKFWPSELNGIECHDGNCTIIGRQDRVIDDQCQCCELLRFESDRDQAGKVTAQRLHGITIYFSMTSKELLLAAARKLSLTMGLTEDEAGKLRLGAPQTFSHPISGNPRVNTSLLTIRIYQQKDVWTVGLSLDRYAM